MASTLKNIREINIRNHSEYGKERHDDVNSIRDMKDHLYCGICQLGCITPRISKINF